MDKSFDLMELANDQILTICKKTPKKREKLEASLPMVRFLTPRNRMLWQVVNHCFA
jgi:hypothetical protein